MIILDEICIELSGGCTKMEGKQDFIDLNVISSTNQDQESLNNLLKLAFPTYKIIDRLMGIRVSIYYVLFETKLSECNGSKRKLYFYTKHSNCSLLISHYQCWGAGADTFFTDSRLWLPKKVAASVSRFINSFFTSSL